MNDTERRVHIAKSGANPRPMCGASANGHPVTKMAHTKVPPGVTCERCIALFHTKSRPTPWPNAAIREVESLREKVEALTRALRDISELIPAGLAAGDIARDALKEPEERKAIGRPLIEVLFPQ